MMTIGMFDLFKGFITTEGSMTMFPEDSVQSALVQIASSSVYMTDTLRGLSLGVTYSFHITTGDPRGSRSCI